MIDLIELTLIVNNGAVNTDPNFPGLAARLNVAESRKKRLKPVQLCIFTRKETAIKTHREEHPRFSNWSKSANFIG